MVVLDTDKKGLDLIFGKPYKSAAIDFILNTKDEVKTKEVHDHIEAQDITISRASVIIFLREMADEGILLQAEESGKGGMHKVYRRNMTLRKLWRHTANLAFTTILAESGFEDLFPLS